MALEPQRLVLLAAGVAMLALATVILATGARRTPHRFLGALLAARGMTVLLPQLGSDPRWRETALNLQPYFGLALIPLAAVCLTASLQGTPRRPGLGWWAAGAIAALDLLYLLDHGLVHTLQPGAAEVGALQAATGLRYTAFGPLWAVVAAGPFLLALLGLRYAVWYRQVAREPDARTWLLLSAGLLVGGLYDGTSRLAAFADLVDHPGSFPWLPWGWAVVGLPVLALLPSALGVAILAANRSIDPRPQHGLEGNLLVLSAFACLTGLLRLLLPPSSDVAGHPLTLVLLGAWRLAMPALLAWALVTDARLRAPAPNGTADPAATAGGA